MSDKCTRVSSAGRGDACARIVPANSRDHFLTLRWLSRNTSAISLHRHPSHFFFLARAYITLPNPRSPRASAAQKNGGPRSLSVHRSSGAEASAGPSASGTRAHSSTSVAKRASFVAPVGLLGRPSVPPRNCRGPDTALPSTPVAAGRGVRRRCTEPRAQPPEASPADIR